MSRGTRTRSIEDCGVPGYPHEACAGDETISCPGPVGTFQFLFLCLQAISVAFVRAQFSCVEALFSSFCTWEVPFSVFVHRGTFYSVCVLRGTF